MATQQNISTPKTKAAKQTNPASDPASDSKSAKGAFYFLLGSIVLAILFMLLVPFFR